MSNSPLVTYTNISPNKTSPRNHAIDTITIHCYVGQVTAKRGCDGFANPSLEASANYVVGYDGSIGLSVDEADRSWCSGGDLTVNGMTGSVNDHRAVTIEVACDNFHPYAVKDAAYSALLDLVADICKRNNIKKLLWVGNKAFVGQVDKQNMTVHRWFARKACPGDWLYERHGEIAAAVNARLNEEEIDMTKQEVQALIDEEIAKALPVYGTLKDVPSWYRPSVRKLVDKGVMQGTVEGITDPEQMVLNVSEDLCRTVTVLDRLGLLD